MKTEISLIGGCVLNVKCGAKKIENNQIVDVPLEWNMDIMEFINSLSPETAERIRDELNEREFKNDMPSLCSRIRNEEVIDD